MMQCLVGREAGNILMRSVTNVAWLLIRNDCIFISIHFCNVSGSRKTREEYAAAFSFKFAASKLANYFMISRQN